MKRNSALVNEQNKGKCKKSNFYLPGGKIDYKE